MNASEWRRVVGEVVAGTGRTGGDEEATLRAAARLGAMARAAAQPALDKIPLPPAPAETNPVCPSENGAAQMIADLPTPLLLEWLVEAANKNVLPPHAALPGLLERARKEPVLMIPLRAALSERGRWIAAMHEPWRFAARPMPHPEDLDAVRAEWNRLTLSGRLTLFQKLRHMESPVSRALIELDFAKFSVDERSQLIEAFGIGLTQEDRPFLERVAATDRVPRVRMAALEYLIVLPGPQRDRLIQWVRECLVLTSDHFVVCPPPKDDPRFEELGLNPSSGG